MEQKEIRKIFDLKNLEVDSCVIGITNLTEIKKGRITIDDIENSRGEFIGYLSTPGELLLFRDRIGGRNLYYKDMGSKVVVSTDILWVFKQGKRDLAPSDFYLNLNYIEREYLKFQVPFGNETIYTNVLKVMPGEVVSFPNRNRKKYWELKFNENKFNPQDLYDLILDSVKFRVERIPNYTSYCSGGIDSSSITSLAKPREFFSGFYADELFNEMNYIKSLKIEGSSHLIEIIEEDFYNMMTHLSYIMPDPMGGLEIIPQLIVATKTFGRGYYYSFTGEGGDEIFYGYPWNTLVIEVARALRNLVRDRYMVRWESMVEKFLRDAFPPMVLNLIRSGEGADSIPWGWDKSQPVENNIMRFNVEVGLPALLTVGERVGVYSGVMPVSPLIDHNIVDYVASINPEERTKVPKYLLRESMKEILPDRIRLRYDKMGFPVPWEEWKWPMLGSLLSSLKRRRIVNSYLVDECQNSKTMSRKSWSLVNIELICRMLEESEIE